MTVLRGCKERCYLHTEETIRNGTERYGITRVIYHTPPGIVFPTRFSPNQRDIDSEKHASGTSCLDNFDRRLPLLACALSPAAEKTSFLETRLRGCLISSVIFYY